MPVIEIYATVSMALIAAGALVRRFVGCEGNDGDAGAFAMFRLAFDPTTVIGGVNVAIGRVDFTMLREGSRISARNTQTLVAGKSFALDRSGWGTEPEIRWYEDADPRAGEYLLTFVLLDDAFDAETWTVRCDGYRDPADMMPTYPSGGEIVQTIDRTGKPFPQYDFNFVLQPDGTIAGTTAKPGAGTTVVLSFGYANVNVTIARVLFLVSIDGGAEETLELTPTSPSPVAFAGGSAVRDSADHQAGKWQATVTNARSGGWKVRCEGYASSGNLRFPSGQSITKAVSAPGPVDFAFAAKQGQAEPA